MIYLHTIPVNVWQRQAGTWVPYFFNASVVSDVSKYDGTRTTVFDFGAQVQNTGYMPHINDILIPVADMSETGAEIFQSYLTRSNQPYYYAGVNNDWYDRPGIMFLTAFNETKYIFSDIFSVPEYALIAPGTKNVLDVLRMAATQVFNRLIGGHPLLKPTQDANVVPGITAGATLTYDNATPVKLSDLTPIAAGAVGWRHVGGTAYYPPHDNAYSSLYWMATQEFDDISFDLRQEDILQLEVRSRESADSPNQVGAYDKAGNVVSVYLDANGNMVRGQPGDAQSWSLRISFQEVDSTSNAAETGDKARQVLQSSPFVNLSDISILLDMTNRYSITYSQSQQASWSLPVPGVAVKLFGYTASGYLTVPVRAYDFALGKLLIATNDDISLESGY